MKTIKKYLVLPVLAIGFLSPAVAQHGNRSSNNQSRNSSTRQVNPSVRQSNPGISRQNNASSTRQFRQPQSRPARQNPQTNNRGGVNPSISSRNRFPASTNNSIAQRSNRSGIQTNTGRVNNINRGGGNTVVNRGGGNNIVNRGGSTTRYRTGRGGYPARYSYAPRRYSYSGYQRYSILPRTSISIHFGGYPYYYDRGYYYSYYNGFYEPVYAPFGIRVTVLPFGYYPFYIGPTRYYYYGGTYYRNYGTNEYEVIDAPLGAVISDLPKGATVALVNGEKFYEFNGTYYQEGVNSKNEVVYTVVGKNGEINNTDGPLPVTDNAPFKIGELVTTLPENSRQVTIDGQVLFLAPDNSYFKEKNIDGTTWYEVVGVDDTTTQ